MLVFTGLTASVTGHPRLGGVVVLPVNRGWGTMGGHEIRPYTYAAYSS